MEKIPNIHDKYFKQIFSHKAEMQDFISGSFPKEILKKLDFNTLVIENNSYIDNELKENFSDLVYNCMYNSEMTIKIVLLFEHKSSKVDYPHFQILRYILRIWEISSKQNKKPTFVLPLIFYHGKEDWKYKSLKDYFEGLDETLLKYLPIFDYIYINTSDITEDKINKKYKLKTTKISIYTFKYIYQKQEIVDNIDFILENLVAIAKDGNENNFFITLYLYLTNNLTKKQMEIIQEKITQLLPDGNDLLEYFAQQNYKRGIEETIYKTAEKSILQGLPNETIRIICGLTYKQIDNIRKELKKQ